MALCYFKQVCLWGRGVGGCGGGEKLFLNSSSSHHFVTFDL